MSRETVKKEKELLKPGVYENLMTGNACEYDGNGETVYDLDMAETQPLDFLIAYGYTFIRKLDE